MDFPSRPRLSQTSLRISERAWHLTTSADGPAKKLSRPSRRRRKSTANSASWLIGATTPHIGRSILATNSPITRLWRDGSKGLIYRQYRPVYWSPSNQTAWPSQNSSIAKTISAKAVYVAFKLVPGRSCWKSWDSTQTLPRSECHHLDYYTLVAALEYGHQRQPRSRYSIVRREGADGSHYYIVGTDRIEALESLPSSLSVPQEGAEAESLDHWRSLPDQRYRLGRHHLPFAFECSRQPTAADPDG